MIDTNSPTAASDDGDSIDDSRHLRAVIFTLHKAHAELAGPEAAHALVREVMTKGDARRYAAQVLPLLRAERNRRRGERKHQHPKR